MTFSNNDLRAFAGLILMVLASLILIIGNETESIKIILIGLAGFLVGGQMFGKDNSPKTNA